jgi:hypothetical protein
MPAAHHRRVQELAFAIGVFAYILTRFIGSIAR